MNTNFFHNIINMVLVLLGSLMAYDWSAFGFGPEVTGMIIAALSFIKLALNAWRDGLGGLTKVQPPVK